MVKRLLALVTIIFLICDLKGSQPKSADSKSSTIAGSATAIGNTKISDSDPAARAATVKADDAQTHLLGKAIIKPYHRPASQIKTFAYKWFAYIEKKEEPK